MSIKKKLILGFIIPALMLVVSGAWSSFQMRTIGSQVGKMLTDNDRSIQFAVRMNEALERLDSGILYRMHRDEPAFRRIFTKESSEFSQAYKHAYRNITVAGEKDILDSLEAHSARFFQLVEEIGTAANMEDYRIRMFPEFENTQHFISQLRYINYNEMYAAAQGVIDKAQRVALPGDLMILSAILFSVLFIWLTRISIVDPFLNIAESIRSWRETEKYRKPLFSNKNEFSEIAEDLSIIASRIKHGNEQ